MPANTRYDENFIRPEKHPLGMAHETSANISETKKLSERSPEWKKFHGTAPSGGCPIGQPYCLMAKPASIKIKMPTPMWPIIFIMTFDTSRERTCPPSSKKKPACIKKIRLPIESSQSKYVVSANRHPSDSPVSACLYLGLHSRGN